MSLLTIFTRKAPEICGYSFDAVLEDELDFSVTIPSYPVESGAEISDHRIINPCRYRIVGVVTNTPLKQDLMGFAGSMAGGLISNITDNPVVAAVAGMSAGFLASTDGTRSSAALETLIEILEGARPFDVVAGDITLKNMLVTRLTRRKNTENEGGLEFVLELQEFISLDRLTAQGQPSHTQMSAGSVEQSACSSIIEKGVSAVKDVGNSIKEKISSVLDIKDKVTGVVDDVTSVLV